MTRQITIRIEEILEDGSVEETLDTVEQNIDDVISILGAYERDYEKKQAQHVEQAKDAENND